MQATLASVQTALARVQATLARVQTGSRIGADALASVPATLARVLPALACLQAPLAPTNPTVGESARPARLSGDSLTLESPE